MQYEQDGMTLWFGTSDAPAPGDVVPAGTSVPLTVGIRPQDASHIVRVLYRISSDPENVKEVAAPWVRSDSLGKNQYYRAVFPPFRSGEVVEYIPLCRCGDKYVPFSPEQQRKERKFAASFKVTATAETQQQPGVSSILNDLEKAVAPFVAARRPSLRAQKPSKPDTPPRSGDVQKPVQPATPSKTSGSSFKPPSNPPPAVDDNPNEPWFRVYGRVRNQNGEPLLDVIVQAFDQDLRSEQLLGSSPTHEGSYDIRYKQSQFRQAEKDSADLVMKVLEPDGKLLHKTPIQFNVTSELQLDITVGGNPYKGPSEWERLTEMLTPLLEDVAPQLLREDDQYQDISFLAGETNRSRLVIATWMACFRLADKTSREKTPLRPEVFFAFLRQNQPSIFYNSFLQDLRYPDRVTLLEDKILSSLAGMIPDLQFSLLEKGVASNLVPVRVGDSSKEILETLRQIKLRYAAEVVFGGGKGTIGELLQISAVSGQEQTAFMNVFSDHTGTIASFWEKLGSDRTLKPQTVKQIKLSFELGALTRNHIPLVSELVKRFQRGDLKSNLQLAKYSRDDWKKLLMRPGSDGKPIGVPSNIDGDTPDAKLEQYAVILDQQFERLYPTASFAGKLARAEKSPLRAQADVVRFFENNPDFHLDRFRLDHYIAAHPDALQGVKDSTTTLRDLKSAQRLFKLKPTHEAVNALLVQKIDSSQQIYFMGQGQFLTAATASGINKIDAKQIYRRAESLYATALVLFGEYNNSVNGAVPYAVPSQSPDSATQAKIATLPNLQTLFGSLDYCECTYCRSVYSPAAYFVDVLRFLGERNTQGSSINAGKNVQQVLLERRPDLGEIELSCENINTPLTYIDLVNEILEDVVAPPAAVVLDSAIEADLVEGTIKASVLNEFTAKGIAVAPDAQVYSPDSRGQWVVRDAHDAYKIIKNGTTLQSVETHQTFLSAAELRANPQYTNLDAYSKLQGEVFPFNLPFDLWHLQTRAYLDHLGVSQPYLLELFQQRLKDNVTLSPTDLQSDAAWLVLTETERQILTGTLPGKQPWDYWGLAESGNNIPNPDNPGDATQNIAGTWIAVLSSVNVMLNRSGLNYKELLQLLDMQYVNPDGSIYIFDTADPNAANCDTSTFTIRNLTEDALSRMHRFVRLWRKLGCSMWELDMLLPDSNPDPNLTDKRITDAVLQDISQMERLRRRTGLDWRAIYSFYNPIDNNIYFDWAQDGVVVQTLYQRLFLNKLVDAVANFPSTPGQIAGPIAAKVPGILAAFRIREDDLSLILDDLSIATTANLDATILSGIFRTTALAQVLNLNPDAFLRLKRLSAQDPFSAPRSTRKFLELAEKIARSEFTIPELDYLLAHRFTANSGLALEDKAIVTFLDSLRAGLQKITDDMSLKTEETKDAYVKSKLGVLPALAKDKDQVVALSIIDGTWDGTVIQRNALIDSFFTGVLDTTLAKTRLGAIPAGLSPADLQTEVDKRFEYVQPALQTFLLRTQNELLTQQKTADLLQSDVPTTSNLLTTLHLQGGTDNLRTNINDSRLLDRLSDGSFQFDLSETNFPAAFKSLRLLHKNALMITKLQMKPPEVTWWLEGNHAIDMGWMHPRDFPVDSTAQLPLDQWLAIQQFFAWKNTLPKSDLTAFEFATNVLDASQSSDAGIAALAQLMVWDAADITSLAVAFHWVEKAAAFDVIKQQLRQSANLVRLADCRTTLRRLGVNADRAIAWSSAEPTKVVAESLKQTVKSKYDLAQWQQVIQPLQDQFRARKREVLVSWLVTHPDQSKGQNWSDSNGLYSYFLIDVEMSECALTSRLKQAAASVQLFVQRCLLNLEVDILAKTDLDPKWKQWNWMKRFRVWEANRKVFLYPENWIEPELRDEKSSFFLDLEKELMQNDVTKDTAEQAYLNYLEKLEKVANLEVRAMYDEIISQDESVLHVFGRSRSSQAPEYYYRKRINGARWTTWVTVDAGINANHLIAGIHNRRLYLLWPQFLDKAVEPSSFPVPSAGQTAGIQAQADKYWEIRLFWTEWKKGKWTPKVLSNMPARVDQSQTGGNYPENIDFRTRLAPFIQARVYHSDQPESRAPSGSSLFEKIGSQITPVNASTEWLISPPDSQFYNNLIRHNKSSQYFYYTSEAKSAGPPLQSAHENAATIRLLRQIKSEQTFSVIDSQANAFPGNGSFFVWDDRHGYFVDYSWHTELTYVSRAWHTRLISSFQFFIHYHPFVELFIKELNVWGIKGLLNRTIQVAPASIPGSPVPFNFSDYQPDTNVAQPYPVEDVDFTYTGTYAPYNWELFFHVPFFIANKLSTNQRFEEALEWFHYIFYPMSTDTATPDPDTPQQKFWITKPFYKATKADYYKQKIENIMLAIAKGDAQLRAQVEEWRGNPFNPHLIARMRTVAYQKNVLIKYIRTLIAWGDQLFRQETIESINEATQLYILASSVLGPRPKSIPKKVTNPIKTFYQLQQEGIDEFGNALKEIENLVSPDVSSGSKAGDDTPELPYLDVLYFCIPNNENLLVLWDTVADRLFKIRHCMNIEGMVRQLPLFEPPIDPALLVKAAAAGLDIGAVLSDISAPLPLYRFSFMIQRALELATEVKALGSAMLGALERRDVEGLALLRSSNEKVMLDLVRLIKSSSIDETARAKEALDESKKVVQERSAYYQKLVNDGLNAWETTSLVLTGGAIVAEIVATVLNAVGSGTSLIPEVSAGAAGFGGSPSLNVTLGGKSVTDSVSKAAEVSKGISSILQIGAGMTATIGNHMRRADEWSFQARLADKELPQVDKQIATADIRHQIAIQDLANQDKLIENAEKENEYLTTKFTNQDLYDWMTDQLSTVFFQSYQLAYDIAKRAERCFRYELGLSDSSYIQFGYWDSLKKGLLSGEKLFYDLKRLEAAYYEQNRREYELTKNISLAQLDPIGLLKLKQNGECFVDVPEAAFDMDYPGHYFRRLKTVALSIPCTTGPYTTLACTLTLTSNHLRKDSTLLTNKYERDLTIDDPRFRDEIAAIQSIASSNAQNDSGMFELNFRDDRYLPFEGAGAISSWHVKLNSEVPQIDFSSIADVIFHFKFTAREGGELLRSKAIVEFNKKMNELALAESRRGLFRIFDLKREYPDKWYRFLHPPNPNDDQAIVLDDMAERLPYFTRPFSIKKARQIEVVALINDTSTYKVMLSPLGAAASDLLSLSPDTTYEGMHRVLRDLTGSEISLGAWTLKVMPDGASDFKSLPPSAIKDLFLIINYTIA